MSTNALKNRTVWLAVSAMFILNGGLFGIWASRIPAIANQHHLSTGDLGWLLLLLAAGAIASFPFAGWMADKIGAAILTRRIAIAYAGSLILIALAPNALTLAVALFLFGITHGSMDVAMNAWAGEAERHIGQSVMSSFHAMFSLGAGIGAATGYIAAVYGLSVLLHFSIVGAITAILTLPLANINWISDAPARLNSTAIFQLPRGPLLFVAIIAFCASIGEGGMADWSAIFLVLTSGATEADAALGYTAFSAAMVTMRLLGDKVTQHTGPAKTVRFAGAVAATGVLCAVSFGNYYLSLVGFILMGLGYAVIVPLAFARAANDPLLAPGTAIAKVATLGYGGMLIGPPLIGFISEVTSIRIAFLVLAILACVIVAFADYVKTDS